MSVDTEQEYEISEKIKNLCFDAREAWLCLANLPDAKRNEILKKTAEKVAAEKEIILAANARDIEEGKKAGLTDALIDRLTLNEDRFSGLIQSLQEIQELPDPLGRTLETINRPNGLTITKISVPIGVICLVYESRPNVTIEAGALAIKSGNAMILKGGKEAFHSNTALAKCFTDVFEDMQLHRGMVSLIPFKERQATAELLKQKETVDLIIPRGGEGLIEFVVNNSLIPVLKHYKGLCHTYIDQEADYQKAINIAINAKAQRPGVCNAMETLLIHQEIADEILESLAQGMRDKGIELRGCKRTLELDATISAATEEDWKTEYLDKILSIRIVESTDAAIRHIEQYGSRHSEAIVTENKQTAAHFIQSVDATAIFVNASTRFNDGGQFGLGAEMGISTDKLHARGPMGVREMTTYKWVVVGDGHIRE